MAARSDVRQREFGSTDWSIIRQLDGPDAELALTKFTSSTGSRFMPM